MRIKKIRMIKKKIEVQFSNTPEHQLMLAVIKQAFTDLTDDSNMVVKSAKKYLKGNMVHAQLCDVDPEWIRRVINEKGLDIY